jgi:F420-dependent oxidoreductase-like protein
MIDLRRSVDEVTAQLAGYAEQGFSSAWASQIFGYDAMTLLAVAGSRVPGIDVGTFVVPVYSRLPQAMAQQALTVQAATGGRFVLGIGLSHKMVVEGMWGLTFDRPARYLHEYLDALMPMLAGTAVHAQGEVITAHTAGPLEIEAPPPPVLVAALGPAMLRLAGRLADGTATWMTGIATVANHVVPTITAAAAEAGRPAPRVAVALPVTVTADPEQARQRIDRAYAIYPTLPSYKAMLDREGATRPSDIALVGDEEAVAAGMTRLAEAGATDFLAGVTGNAEERDRTDAVVTGWSGA